MSTEDVSIDDIAGLIQVAKWISYLIMSGVVLSACVCILRSIKQTEFTLGQLKLSLTKFPYVIATFTGAHLFLTWVFFQRVAALKSDGLEVSKQAWHKLTTSEPFVFFNMKPRDWTKAAGPFGTGTYVASSADTAFWCTLAFALVLIAAIVASRLPLGPLRMLPKRKIINLLAFACVLALINWMIGSQWSVAASSLLQSATMPH